MTQKVDISTSTFVRFILVLLAFWFLYLIRDVLALLFVVLIIVAGLSPVVERWAKSITRPGAVIVVFLLILLAMGGIASLLIPPLVSQLQQFSSNLPAYIDSFSQLPHGGLLDQTTRLIIENVNTITGQLTDLSGSLFTKTLGVVNGLVAAVTVFVLAFYLLLEEEGLKKLYRGLLPPEMHEGIAETTKKIASKLGAWLQGQLILMLIVGFFVTIGLLIAGVPFALTLGVWAGLTEVVPMVGPLIGAVPGIIVGLTVSPLHGLLAFIIYAIVQQAESNFIVPRVMSRAVGLNPVVVIIAILIGGKLYGLLGVLLAVPLAAIIGVVAQDWSVIREAWTNRRT